MSREGRATVLVVEDEPDVAETYELWLAGEYEVLRAESGQEALSMVDDTVDVVLLDRMMPEMSGDEVLEEIRSRGLGCRVAIVSAVDPDFDVIEMGFDEYVTKPPKRDALRETVAKLIASDAYAERAQEYRSLVAKRAALLEEKSGSELARSEEFAELEAAISDRRTELQSEDDHLRDDAAFVSTLRDLVGDEETTEGGRDP